MVGLMDGCEWMYRDGWIDAWMNGCLKEWKDVVYTNRWMDVNGFIYAGMNRWMNVNGWMDGWISG